MGGGLYLLLFANALLKSDVMSYLKDLVYHVYNQGNNKQKIFFEEENYHFFIRKMKTHLLPHADLLCYCLMPNHFHWLLIPKQAGIDPGTAVKPRMKLGLGLESADTFEVSADSKPNPDFQQNLSQQIGILLSSYTKAINKRFDRSGSLFRSRTKFKHGVNEDLATFLNHHPGKVFPSGNQYARQCFEYIHQNPVKAGLVNHAEDWPFSSARAYADFPGERLCNQELAKKLLE